MRRAKLILIALLGTGIASLSVAHRHYVAFANEAASERQHSFATAASESFSFFEAPTAVSDSGGSSSHSPFILSQPKPAIPFPIVLNRLVQSYVHDYLERPESLEASFERSRPFFLEMTKTLRAKGVPDDLVYLSFAESDFTKRGKGPWQFNKGTAQRYGLRIDHWVDERRDPILSTKAAAEYLSDLHDAAGRDWRVAIVGWNGGDLAIDRYWLLRGENFNRFMDLLPGHTRALMGRFMAVAFIAHNSAAYAIGNLDYNVASSYHEVPVKGGTTLGQVANSYKTTVQKLHDLNPAILRDRVPPYARNYKVRVPLVRTASAR